MGNRFSRNPPEVKHELLNEYSDRYFERVQVRNGVLPKRSRWGRRKRQTKDDHSSRGSWDEAAGGTLTDGFTTTSGNHEEESSARCLPPSIDTYLSNYGNIPSPHRCRRHEDQNNERSRRQQRRRRKAAIDGWQVKRKGNHALQLRLAKNRILQLITSGGSMPAATSPITLDSGLDSRSHLSHSKDNTADNDGDRFEQLESPSSREDLNSEFEEMVSTGMIWVEVARTTKVTAVAMSRSNCAERKGPLLLAVGGDDGILTVTELLDEREHHISGGGAYRYSPEDGSSVAALSVDSSGLRKFGLTLEFPLEGRIRSVDFSPNGEFLAVGGDCCSAPCDSRPTNFFLERSPSDTTSRANRSHLCSSV
jgi:hypothetical protein